MPLQTTLIADIKAVQSLAADLGTGEFRLALDAVRKELSSGTGDNQADKMWSDERSLNASASENIDLSGALVDGLGQAVVFAKIRAILIRAAAENTNDVIFGDGGSNAFLGPFGSSEDTLAVRPGGFAFLAAPEGGWTVTAGTGDLLKVANGSSGSAVTYEIVLIGTSA